MKQITLILALISSSAFAQIPIVSPDADIYRAQQEKTIKRLTDGNVLLTDSDLTKARLAVCQPSKGDLVLIRKVENIAGGSMAFVEVTTGLCEKHTGWVGTGRYEAMTTADKT